MLAVASAHVAVADVGRRRAVDRRDLHDHVVLLAFPLEARDLTTAEHRLQRPANRFHGDANIGKLVAVDRDADFGRVESQIDLQVLDAGILARFVEKAIDDPLQLGIRHLRHYHVFDRRRAEELAERRRIDGERERPGDRHDLRPHFVGDLLLLLRPLLPRLQPQDRVAVDHRRKPRDGGVRGCLGNLRKHLLDRLDLVRRVLRRRALRRGHQREHDPAILDRRELGLEHGEEHAARARGRRSTRRRRKCGDAAPCRARDGTRG